MSKLEDTYALKCRQVGLPKPKREFRAVDGRRFRWDFCFDGPFGGFKGLLVEIQGGIFLPKGGHTSAAGVTRDCEKNNLALENKWLCLYFTSQAVNSGDAALTTQRVLEMLKAI